MGLDGAGDARTSPTLECQHRTRDHDVPTLLRGALPCRHKPPVIEQVPNETAEARPGLLG